MRKVKMAVPEHYYRWLWGLKEYPLKATGLGPLPPEVEERWQVAERQDANVAVCGRCGGPTANIQALVCRRCDERL